jgi:hypothetical protein
MPRFSARMAFTPFCPKRSRGGRCSRRRPRFPRDPREFRRSDGMIEIGSSITADATRPRAPPRTSSMMEAVVRCDGRRRQRCALMKARQQVPAPRGGQPITSAAQGCPIRIECDKQRRQGAAMDAQKPDNGGSLSRNPRKNFFLSVNYLTLREGATQFPTIGLFERNANNFKGTRNTKAQKSWSSRAEPEVRIHLPPAESLVRTCPTLLRRSATHSISRCGWVQIAVFHCGLLRLG